jgi:hypothetical protein
MSFGRHKEIFRSDEGVRERQPICRPRAHRLDEFPVGYSWRVALQQSPLPLHQPRLIVRRRSAEGKNIFDPVILWLNFLSHLRGAPQAEA